MSHELDPKVGRWYRRVDDEQLFKVVSIDVEQNLLVLRGAVPGAPEGVVLIRRAIAKKKDPQPQAEKAKKGKAAAGKK